MDRIGPIHIGIDHLVELYGLYDRKAKTFENDAIVTAQVYQADRTATVGSPVSLQYIAGSDGDYCGSIGKDVTENLSPDTTYFVRIEINAKSPEVYDDRWLQRTGRYRGRR